MCNRGAWYQKCMRCDLHVHTIHSGMCTIPGLRGFVRESYTDPDALYDTLRERGMDLVTVTDHDSISACEALAHHSNVFLSEEITCRTPLGTEAHIAVYDLNSRQHVELQRRRDDLPRLAAYVREQGLLASVNHLASCLTGRRRPEDFAEFERFEAFEGLNGQVLAANNACARAFAVRLGKTMLAGSDAHTMRAAGRTSTWVPGARNRQEFFAGLRNGYGRLVGVDGCWSGLTCDVLAIIVAMLSEQPLAGLLAPVLPLVPVVTALQFLADALAARRWRRLADANPGAYAEEAA